MHDMHDDDALLDALGVEVAPLKAASRTPREERIMAGFEDILRFHQSHRRAPEHGDGRDIFERIYAVRLDRLRKLPEALALLAAMDAPGLLTESETAVRVAAGAAEDGDDTLLAELGVDAMEADATADPQDITVLRHVRTDADKRASEDIADHTPCPDFERFAPLFEQAARELKSGLRQSLRFGRDASVAVGDFFILGGQLAYVSEIGAQYRTPNKETNARMRVIYANETESDLLMRSLQRALYKDESGRRLTEPGQGPLFGDAREPDDIESGTIYVLRSLSDHPFVAEHRELIHKIGVTGGSVEARIAAAPKDATYLLAGVQVVASYKLHNINRTRLENLFHRVFAQAQLDLTIADRFGNPVKPREWFLVPLDVIDDVVKRMMDGSIAGLAYDPEHAMLVSA